MGGDIFDQMAAQDPRLQGAPQGVQQPQGDIFDQMAAKDPRLQQAQGGPQPGSPPPQQSNPVRDAWRPVQQAAYNAPYGIGKGIQSMGQVFNNANQAGQNFFQNIQGKGADPNAPHAMAGQFGAGVTGAASGLAGLGESAVGLAGQAFSPQTRDAMGQDLQTLTGGELPSKRISDLGHKYYPHDAATQATGEAASMLAPIPGVNRIEMEALGLLMKNPVLKGIAEEIAKHPNIMNPVVKGAAKGAPAGAVYNAAVGAGNKYVRGEQPTAQSVGEDVGAGATMGATIGGALGPLTSRGQKPPKWKLNEPTYGPDAPKGPPSPTEAQRAESTPKGPPSPKHPEYGHGMPGFDYWHGEPAKPPVKGGVPAVIPKKTVLGRILKPEEAPPSQPDAYTIPPEDIRIIKPTKEIESGQPTGPRRIGMDRPGQEPPRESYYHETRPSYYAQEGPQYGSEPTPEQVQAAEQRRTAGDPSQAWRGGQQAAPPPAPRKLSEIKKEPVAAAPPTPEAPQFKSPAEAMDVLNNGKSSPAALDAAQKYLEGSFAERASKKKLQPQEQPKPKLSDVVRQPEPPQQEDFTPPEPAQTQAPPVEEPPVMQPDAFNEAIKGKVQDEPMAPGEAEGRQAADDLYKEMGKTQRTSTYEHGEKEAVPASDVTEYDKVEPYGTRKRGDAHSPWDNSKKEPRLGIWQGNAHVMEPHPTKDDHVTVGAKMQKKSGLADQKTIDAALQRMREGTTIGQMIRDAKERGLSPAQLKSLRTQMEMGAHHQDLAGYEEALRHHNERAERPEPIPEPEPPGEYNKPTKPRNQDPTAQYEHDQALTSAERNRYPAAFDKHNLYAPGEMISPPIGEVNARSMTTGELKHEVDRILKEAKRNKTSGKHGDEVNPHRLNDNTTDFKYWNTFNQELKRRADREFHGETKDWPSEDGYHEPVDYSKVPTNELHEHTDSGSDRNQQEAANEAIKRHKGEEQAKQLQDAIDNNDMAALDKMAQQPPKKLSTLKSPELPMMPGVFSVAPMVLKLAKFAGKTLKWAAHELLGKDWVEAASDFAKMNNTLDNIREGGASHGDDIFKKLMHNLGSEAFHTRGLKMEGQFGDEARQAIRTEDPHAILNPLNHTNWTPQQRKLVAARKIHRMDTKDMINDVLDKHGDTIDPKYEKALNEYKNEQFGHQSGERGALERAIDNTTGNLYNSFFRWNPAFHALIATHPLQMGTAVAGVHNIATAYHQLINNPSMRKLYGDLGEVTEDPRQQMGEERRQRQMQDSKLAGFINKPLAKPLAKDLPTSRINNSVIHLGGMLKKANEMSKGNGLDMVQRLADGTLPKDQAIELHTAGMEALIDATGGGSFGMNRNYLQSSPVFKYFAQLSGYKSVVARYNSKLARGMADGIKNGDYKKAAEHFASFATLTGATILLGGHAIIPKEAEEPLAAIMGPSNLYGLEAGLDNLNLPRKAGVDLTRHLQYSAINYGENAIGQSMAGLGRDLIKSLNPEAVQDKTPAEVYTDTLGHVLMMSRFSAPGGIGMSTLMRAKQGLMDQQRGYKKLNIYSKDWMSPNPFADEKHMAAVNTGDMLYKLFAPGEETREGNVEQRVKFNKYFKKHGTRGEHMPNMEEEYPVKHKGIDQRYH